MPCSLDHAAVLHALSTLGAWHGSGIVGKNNKTADGGPGKQGAQEMLDAGNDVFGEAPRQVSVGGHESGEAESGVGHPADEGMVIGGSPSVGDGDGSFKAKVVGQGPKADDAYLEGHLAAECVDARPDLVHRLGPPLAGNFSLPLICSHFLPFGRVSAGGTWLPSLMGAEGFHGRGLRGGLGRGKCQLGGWESELGFTGFMG